MPQSGDRKAHPPRVRLPPAPLLFLNVEKVRTSQRPPAPGQWCVIPGRAFPHIAKYNGNGGFNIIGFLCAYRSADRVDWWSPLPRELTAQYDEPDAEVECRVESWGPR